MESQKPFYKKRNFLGIFAVIVIVSVIAIYSVNRTSCLTASQSWNYIGKHECVQFKVGYAYTSWKNNTFLDQYSNYRSGFAVYVPDGSGLSSSEARGFLNKTIAVTGTITRYQGAPQIQVSDPSQIKSVN